MRLRWAAFVLSASSLFTSCGSQARPQARIDSPAFEFLFERRPFQVDCDDRTPGQPPKPGVSLHSGNEAPFLRTHSEEVTLPSHDAPALTITADPSHQIFIGGSDRSDWSIRYCARGEGNSEAEARGNIDLVSMSILAATVSLKDSQILVLGERPQSSGTFVLDAPAEAPIVIHASFASVEVHDMTGPVRIAAAHGRAGILDTTGQVDAAAYMIDYAGSRGRVNLSAEFGINVKMTATRFEGTMMAWSQGPLRVLVPPGFMTPFQAVVNRPQDFVCRADFCGKLKHEKNNSLDIFTYLGDAGTAPGLMHWRSEQATVVIDTTVPVTHGKSGQR